MEFFEVLDKNGKPTGQKKLRSEVHRDGDFHQSIDIWLINKEDQILIQKRTPDKESYPDLWEVSCSGHVGFGEKVLTAALREFEEELGLKIHPSEIKPLFSTQESHVTNNGTFINREFKEVYLVRKNVSRRDINFQKDEISAVKFLTLPELEKMLKDHPEEFVPHENVFHKSLEIFHELLK